MKTDHLAGWVRFLASPAAPATALLPLELDGYLTGIIVAPDLILPSQWIDGLWGEDEPLFDSTEQAQAALGSVMEHYNATIDLIERQGAKYRPMFMDAKGKADLAKAHIWVRGFWRAMAFVPDAWEALVEDERTEILVEPFAVFADLEALGRGPMPEDIDEIRRDNAAFIPRVLPALRELAKMRAVRPQARDSTGRKPGRNAPCRCGSGKKYKRCCGLN